jgi:predicted RNA-binding Zn-ribbon protein involved in translation (DUF1610 family)
VGQFSISANKVVEFNENVMFFTIVNEVCLTMSPTEKKGPHYGKPTYRTEVVKPAKDGVSKGGAMLGGALLFGWIGENLGGGWGSLIGIAIGIGLGSKVKPEAGTPAVTRQVEITSPCIKCGGSGQVTARVDNVTGFQCPTCGNFWKKSDTDA